MRFLSLMPLLFLMLIISYIFMPNFTGMYRVSFSHSSFNLYFRIVLLSFAILPFVQTDVFGRDDVKIKGNISLCLQKLEGVNNIYSAQLIKLVRENNETVVIDGRNRREWAQGHLDGSINISLKELTEEGLMKKVAKEKVVVFYCNGTSCRRTLAIVKKVKYWGWKKIHWFNGGLREWTNNGYPLVKGE